MTSKRKQFSAQFKFKVALAAANNQKTQSQLAAEFGAHPSQIKQWKKALLESGPAVFEKRPNKQAAQSAQRETELFEQIGRLKMELEWLKKKAGHLA